MDDCGSLRRDGCVLELGGGDDALLVVVLLLKAALVVLSVACAVLLCLSLRGASLIRPASLRWWSSRRLRIRRAYVSVRYGDAELGGVSLQYCGYLGQLHEMP